MRRRECHVSALGWAGLAQTSDRKYCIQAESEEEGESERLGELVMAQSVCV